MLALRCVLLSTDVLSTFGLPSEAASQLLKVSGPSLSDFFNAVLFGYAAQLFERAKRLRRTIFYSVLAAHRFIKSGNTWLMDLIQISNLHEQQVSTNSPSTTTKKHSSYSGKRTGIWLKVTFSYHSAMNCRDGL